MIIKANGEITSESEINKEEEVEEEPEDEAMQGDMLMVRSDIAPYRACRPWIFFIDFKFIGDFSICLHDHGPPGWTVRSNMPST